MGGLDADTVSALRDIDAELGVLRVDAPSAVGSVMPEIRRLLDAPNVILYSVTQAPRGWRLRRWHHAGPVERLHGRIRAAFATAPAFPLVYDPRVPERSMRNRVVEAVGMINRDRDDAWQSSAICQRVMAPLRMETHRHLRVLLCEGPELLAWFGSIMPDAPTRRQHRVMTAVARLIRRRLVTEARVASGSRGLHALEVVLEQIGAPAFVVSRPGAILHANTAGRALADHERAAVVGAIRTARSGPAVPGVQLVPIVSSGAPDAWIAIVRDHGSRARAADALTRAAVRWNLTERQRAVLAHVVNGDSTRQIAAHLGVGARAVELHVTALLDRVAVESRSALVAAVLTAPT